MPKAPSRIIVGPENDYLLEGGKRPRVSAEREYIAGGGSAFPLVGQLELSRSVDDLSRDLGMAVYDAMLNDPTVAGALHVLITGVLSGDFEVLPAIVPDDGEEVEPGSDREVDIQIAKDEAEFVKRSLDRLPVSIDTLCYDLAFAWAYGCKLAEMVYEPGTDEDEGRLVLKLIRVKRNQSWSFIVDPAGNVVAIRALCFDTGLHDLPPEKFMIATWMPRDADPRGRSLLRHAYNGWNLKINTWPLFFRYLELFGSPIPYAIAAPDAPDEPEYDDRGNPTGRMILPTEAQAQMLARLKTGSYASLPHGAQLNFVQAVGNGESFQEAFRLYKMEILEGIIMSARAVLESKRSSKADAEQATDVVGQMLIFCRNWYEDLWTRQCFRRLTVLNKGEAYAQKYSPRCSLGNIDHHDVAIMLQALSKAGYTLDPSQFPAADAMLGMPVRKRSAVAAAQQAAQEADPLGQQPNDPNAVANTNYDPVSL